MSASPILLDSITDVDTAAAGRVVVSGSHGGIYPAMVASRAGVRAVIFNDAGGGLDQAGVAGVLALADAGMAAAAADCMSCRIGSAEDMMAGGRISAVNAVAMQLGIDAGMAVAEAVALLAAAAAPGSMLPPVAESRAEVTPAGAGEAVLLLDSASLVKPQDAGRLIVTGSHGGLIGGDPKRALKAPARLAVFNDAGFGKDRCAVTRLPALDAAGVAAATVSNTSARIGDARSAYETGTLSAVNDTARGLSLEVGQRLAQAIGRLVR